MSEAPAGLDQGLYSEDYYRTAVAGALSWADFKSATDLQFPQTWALTRALDHGARSLLDFGCGRGELVIAAHLMGLRAVGYDPSRAAIEIALERGGGASFVDRIPADRFDAVTMIDVVEHVKAQRLLVRSAVDRLNPGGIFLAYTFPNVWRRKIGWPLLCAVRGKWPPPPESDQVAPNYRLLHVREVSPRRLADLLRGAGLKGVKTGVLPEKWPGFARRMLSLGPLKYIFDHGLCAWGYRDG